MTKLAESSTRASTTPFSIAPFDFGNLTDQPIFAYALPSPDLVKNVMASHQEIVHLANDRLWANVKRFQDMSSCTSWNDLVAIHLEFLGNTAEAYAATIQKLAEHTSRSCIAALGERKVTEESNSTSRSLS